MAFMEWQDSLSVKIPEFDDAHKKLIEIINNLHNAMKQGKGKEIVAPLIKELKKYTQEHFQQEEGFLKKYEYADLLVHQDAHKKFVGQISGLEKDFETGKLTVAIDLLNFLNDWLVKHIKEVDGKYSRDLAGKPL